MLQYQRVVIHIYYTAFVKTIYPKELIFQIINLKVFFKLILCRDPTECHVTFSLGTSTVAQVPVLHPPAEGFQFSGHSHGFTLAKGQTCSSHCCAGERPGGLGAGVGVSVLCMPVCSTSPWLLNAGAPGEFLGWGGLNTSCSLDQRRTN